jgi:hypothetical protein
VRETAWTPETYERVFQQINGSIVSMADWRKALADTLAWIEPLLPNTTIGGSSGGPADHYVFFHAAAEKASTQDFIVIRLRVHGDIGYLSTLIKRRGQLSALYTDSWFAEVNPPQEVVTIDKLRLVFAKVLYENWQKELRHHVFLAAVPGSGNPTK